MRATSIAIALGALLAGPASAQQSGPADAVKKWADAYSSNSTDAVVSVYTSDALLYGNRSKTLGEGSAAVRSYFAKIATGNKVECVDQKIVSTGPDSAFATGICNFTVTREGKPVGSPSRSTMVLVRQNGEWLIKHHHVSRVPD